MGKLTRKYTPGSNLASMSPEKRAKAEAFLHEDMDQVFADALNKGVREDCERRRRKQEQAEQSRAGEVEAQLEKKD